MAAAILMFSWYQVSKQADFTYQAIRAQALTLTQNLSIAAGNYLISEDFTALEQLMLQSAAFPEVKELLVMNTDGRVFGHVLKADDNTLTPVFDSHNLNPPHNPKPYTEHGDRLLVIWYPIESGEVGWIKADFSLQKVFDLQQGIIRDAFIAALLALLVSLLLLFVVIRRPVAAIENATRFARSLFESRGEVMPVSKGSIELEQLGHALNYASISLHSATREMADIKFALDAHAIVGMTDAKGRISYANENFCDISGYSPEELIGKTYAILRSGHQPDSFYENLWQTISQGKVWHGEMLDIKKSGEPYWVDSTIVPFLSDTGEPYQYVCIQSDITERKQAEEVTARLGRMLDNSTNEIYLFSRDDLKLLQMNFGAQLNLALSNSRIRGMSMLDIQKDIGKKKFLKLAQPLVDGQQTGVLYETTYYRSDGTGYPVEVRLQYYKDETPPLFVAIVQDITERKEAEKLLQDYQEHLEEMVEDRTNELSMANKELESFCYSVSHDLRAPLRSIDGFSQALMEDFGDELSDDALAYLKRVRASSQRMGELIDDLLSLSRVVRSEMVYTEVDISSIASSILSELRDNDKSRNVEFSVQPDLYVQGDGRLIRVLLENMLGNAWKFTSKKDHARIDFGMEMQDGREVYFVRDNGAGFDETYSHKLFEPFQRLHTTEEFEGTGIGLATVRRIVRRHNGDVWAKSKIGEGATVYFTLG